MHIRREHLLEETETGKRETEIDPTNIREEGVALFPSDAPASLPAFEPPEGWTVVSTTRKVTASWSYSRPSDGGSYYMAGIRLDESGIVEYAGTQIYWD
jgi:hypothetical protein